MATKQVHDMVRKLESQQQMRYAVTEICANLVQFAQRLGQVGERASLDSLDSMGPLFETLAIKLCEAGEVMADIEAVSGVTVDGNTTQGG